MEVSLAFFSSYGSSLAPKLLQLSPFFILVFFHKSDRPFRPKMQIGPMDVICYVWIDITVHWRVGSFKPTWR